MLAVCLQIALCQMKQNEKSYIKFSSITSEYQKNDKELNFNWGPDLKVEPPADYKYLYPKYSKCNACLF